MSLGMTRLVLKLPEGLAKKVADAAEDEDMLPTEWVRDLIREAFEDDQGTDEETEADPDG